MKKLKLFLLTFLFFGFANAGIYDGVVIDTGTKTAERNLSGLLGIAKDADTPSTYLITLDGSDGTIKSEIYSYGTPTELTIATGVITAIRSYHKVDTQADDATDELDTINGGSAGMLLILTSENDGRDTTLKHGTGNLRLSQGNDFILDNINATIILIYNGTNWLEISRSANL